MALLAHWKCDENTGKGTPPGGIVADSSGHINKHHFTSHNFYTWTLGFWNRERHALGYDWHNVVNYLADFLINGDMSIMAWVSPEATPTGDEYIIGCGDENSELQADNVLWSLLHRSDGSFGMRWEQGAGLEVTAYSPASQIPHTTSEGFPTHIAVVRSINGAFRDVKFIRNGVDLAADKTGLTAPDGGANALCEMLREPGQANLFFRGRVSDIRVYDTAESVGNVLAVYNAELPSKARVAKFDDSSMLPTHVNDKPLYGRRATGSELAAAGQGQAGWTQELA